MSDNELRDRLSAVIDKALGAWDEDPFDIRTDTEAAAQAIIDELDRFITKVRADALREAAEDMDNTDDPDAIHIANGDADLWLKARADRIEADS